MAWDAPLTTFTGKVLPEWVDHYGHLNVVYYGLVFDQALTEFMAKIGLGSAYRELTPNGFFVVESHIIYVREVKQGEPIAVTTQFVDRDHKRLRLISQMRHGTAGHPIATHEQLLLHVNRVERRAGDMPAEVQDLLDELKGDHAHLPLPPRAGHGIAIPRK